MANQHLLDSLVVRYEELLTCGTPVTAEELCKDCPELLGELKRQILVLESMNALLGAAEENTPSADLSNPHGVGSEPLPSVSTEAVAAASRFRVLHPHASGGLGEVLVARDEELGRDVALKRLKNAHRHNPQSRSRFLREAEITSRLEHPSIAPVHALGQDAQGRPFYAMRFVQGETLRQASLKFHAADTPGRSPGERSLALRQLLGRFVAICNTVGYAHSLGILHRDIKPDNIVLGPFGETILVDWGLAKDTRAQHKNAGDASKAIHSDSPEAPTIADAHGPTQQGAIIGTPGFMSPEQAAGKSEALEPASDVYSLGATLYLLLTGLAPFSGRHVGEVLDRVKRGDFVPPRQCKKGVPPALDAICTKAMALQPDQRYASALALAADLEHWLADEPVAAWREPWLVRARRWGGRHRTLVASLSAAALVALVALSAVTVFLNAANRREQALRSAAQLSAIDAQDQRRQAEEKSVEARKQQERAAQNFKLARQSVDKYCTLVAKDPRLHEHDLDDLRKELLRTAAQFCDEFVRERSDDWEVLADQGRAYMMLGFITEETGAKPEAISHYEKSRSIFEELARAHGGIVDYRRQQAKCRDHLGRLYEATGRMAEAKAQIEQALNIRQEIAGAHANDSDCQNELASSYGSLGIWYLTDRQWNRAKDELGKALDIRKELVQQHPDVVAYQTNLADLQNNLAIVYQNLRQPKKVEETLVASLGVWEKLIRANPTSVDYRSHLAIAHNNLGILYMESRRPQQAEAEYQEAVKLREALASAHPTVSDYQSKLARTYFNLGVLFQEKRPGEAEMAYQKSSAINRKLVETHPLVTVYALDLGKTCDRLGHMLHARKPEAALQWFDEAARMLESILQRQPSHREARQNLSRVHAGRALALNQQRLYSEAVKEWDLALKDGGSPSQNSWQMQKALTMARAGDHAGAASEATLLVKKLPANGGVLYDAACVYALAAASAKQPADRVMAEGYAASAMKFLLEAQSAGYFKSLANRDRLQKDSDLVVLQTREEFKRLAGSVELPVQGK
jgi:serine/threonine-protein kinase